MALLDKRRLEEILRNTQGMDRAVAEAAFAVEGGAKMRAPVDTGALRASIQAGRIQPAYWRVSVGVEYGIYQELGTHKMAAQPFLVPAVEAESRNFPGRVRAVVLAK